MAWEDKIKELEQIIGKKDSQIDTLKSEFSKLEEDCEDAYRKFTGLNAKYNEEMENHKKEIEKFRVDLDKYTQKINFLEQQAKVSEDERRELTSQLIHCRGKIEATKQQNETLMTTVNDYQNKAALLEAKIKTNEKIVEEAKQKAKEAEKILGSRAKKTRTLIYAVSGSAILIFGSLNYYQFYQSKKNEKEMAHKSGQIEKLEEKADMLEEFYEIRKQVGDPVAYHFVDKCYKIAKSADEFEIKEETKKKIAKDALAIAKLLEKESINIEGAIEKINSLSQYIAESTSTYKTR